MSMFCIIIFAYFPISNAILGAVNAYCNNLLRRKVNTHTCTKIAVYCLSQHNKLSKNLKTALNLHYRKTTTRLPYITSALTHNS